MHRRGKKLHNDLVETYGGIIKDMERKMKAGNKVVDCLAKTMIEVRRKEDLDDLDMATLASAFMIGDVETVCHCHDSLCPLNHRLFFRLPPLCSGLLL